MPTIHLDGEWPNPITLSAGWFRARARPWNENVTAPMVRLERGGAEFLTSVTRRLEDLGEPYQLSPALFGSATRVWQRAGFDEYATLDVMERSLASAADEPADAEVVPVQSPNWDEILQVDRSAFEGFWAMSRDGLRDAVFANRRSVVLVTRDRTRTTGYAIVGTQWGTAYLHRIAVDPEMAGQGLGGALLATSINWARSSGSKSMVLNVRPENTRARRLYERASFIMTGADLTVLRHCSSTC